MNLYFYLIIAHPMRNASARSIRRCCCSWGLATFQTSPSPGWGAPCVARKVPPVPAIAAIAAIAAAMGGDSHSRRSDEDHILGYIWGYLKHI